MIQITPIQTGIPVKTATQLSIRTFFDLSATTADIYYEIKDENGAVLSNGNLQLTEQEYEDWAADNTFVENIVLTRLGLIRA